MYFIKSAMPPARNLPLNNKPISSRNCEEYAEHIYIETVVFAGHDEQLVAQKIDYLGLMHLG